MPALHVGAEVDTYYNMGDKFRCDGMHYVMCSMYNMHIVPKWHMKTIIKRGPSIKNDTKYGCRRRSKTTSKNIDEWMRNLCQDGDIESNPGPTPINNEMVKEEDENLFHTDLDIGIPEPINDVNNEEIARMDIDVNNNVEEGNDNNIEINDNINDEKTADTDGRSTAPTTTNKQQEKHVRWQDTVEEIDEWRWSDDKKKKTPKEEQQQKFLYQASREGKQKDPFQIKITDNSGRWTGRTTDAYPVTWGIYVRKEKPGKETENIEKQREDAKQNEKIEKLGREIETKNKEIKELKEENDGLKKVVKEVKEENEGLKKVVKEVREENKSTKEALNRERMERKSDIESLRQEILKLNLETRHPKTTVTNREAQNKEEEESESEEDEEDEDEDENKHEYDGRNMMTNDGKFYQKMIKCEVCDIKTPDIRRHMRFDHPGVKHKHGVTCTGCKRQFATVAKRSAHEKCCQQVRVKCKTCNEEVWKLRKDNHICKKKGTQQEEPSSSSKKRDAPPDTKSERKERTKPIKIGTKKQKVLKVNQSNETGMTNIEDGENGDDTPESRSPTTRRKVPERKLTRQNAIGPDRS